jgi:hypothetical protein
VLLYVALVSWIVWGVYVIFGMLELFGISILLIIQLKYILTPKLMDFLGYKRIDKLTDSDKLNNN